MDTINSTTDDGTDVGTIVVTRSGWGTVMLQLLNAA
jgi:hypothetical protein